MRRVALAVGALLVAAAIFGSLGYEAGRWWVIQTLNDRGMEALKESRLADAEHYYTALDAIGDRGAAFWLGQINIEGDGVPVDHDKALFWFRRSEEPKPQVYLLIARAYESGDSGTERNPREARFWYRQAMLLGSAEAKRRYEALGGPRNEAVRRHGPPTR